MEQSISKILPNSIEAERAVLSIVLNYPEKFMEISDTLKDEDFYQITFQQIWQAIYNIYKRGEDIDVVSVRTELVKNNKDRNKNFTLLNVFVQ